MVIQQQIQQKLTEQFSPAHLEVINESTNHNVPKGSESHFKVIIVSNEFDAKRLIQRHRMVNQCLAVELSDHIHALAIHTYTLEEWQQDNDVIDSPKCLGGSKGDDVMAAKLGK